MNRFWNRRNLAVLVLTAGTGVAGLVGGSWVRGQNAVSSRSAPVQAAPKYTAEEAARAANSAKDLSLAFRAAADRVLPTLVAIEMNPVTDRSNNNERLAPPRNPFGNRNPFEGTPFEEMFRDQPFPGFRFESPSDPTPRRGGMGSGVIIDEAGLILTNNHVVAGSGQVKIRLHDGREFLAQQVWTDPQTDIAVVKINAERLTAAQLGDSDHAEIGDWVLALGQPFGLESTVTAGIISAKHRGLGITSRESFLQTDAAINPGNSGGPLVNLNGEVIGINTAISSRSGGNDGIGFAVPINLARWVADQLADGGVVRRAYLGVGIQPMNAAIAKKFHVQPREGVLVTEVFPKTPAAKAGLQAGDVIVQFDSQAIGSPQELQVAVERSTMGESQKLVVVRDGNRKELTFVPEEQPKNYGEPAAEESSPPSQLSEPQGALGMELDTLTPEIAKRLGVPNASGVVITAIQPDSPAARLGLKPGMVIAELDRQPVQDLEQAMKVLTDVKEDGVLLLVRSQAGSRYLLLKP
jgi:serine protease Do